MGGGETDRRCTAFSRESDESSSTVAFVVARALPVSLAKNFLVVRRECVAVEEELAGSTLRNDETESSRI